MAVSTSKSAYADCFEYLDRALEAPKGIRARCENRGAAKYLTTRLNYARKLTRDESRSIYTEDDPSHGISPYDHLAIRYFDRDGAWWVYLEPRSVGLVEELPEDQDPCLKLIPAPAPMLMIADRVVEPIKRRRVG